MAGLGGVVAGVVGVVASALVGAGVDRYHVVSKVFPPDPVACPRTSTSLEPGDPVPTADAIVILKGSADGRRGNVVGFKLCRDPSPQAESEFWYFGMSPGPNTNLVPATRVIDDPARYETDENVSTVYSVDCATNIFAYTTNGVERPYGFDEGEC
jgi:hypothetical protein